MKKSWQQPTILIVKLKEVDVLMASLNETGIDTSDWWGGDL